MLLPGLAARGPRRGPQRPEPARETEDRAVMGAAAQPRFRPEPEPDQREGKLADERLKAAPSRPAGPSGAQKAAPAREPLGPRAPRGRDGSAVPG